MKNLIGQKNNDSAKQPSSANEMMYGCSVFNVQLLISIKKNYEQEKTDF